VAEGTSHLIGDSVEGTTNIPNCLPSYTVTSHKTLIFIKNATVHILYVLAFRNSIVLIGPMHDASQIQWEI